MPDDIDRAQEREQQLRQDALAEQEWRTQRDAGREPALCCAVCDEEIPAARRHAVPGVQTCIECQRELEREGLWSLGTAE